MKHVLEAARSAHGTPVQWSTLAWIIGAAVAAAVTIGVIVLVSRRPKSMEHGIAEFSRSLQAVAPSHRSVPRTSSAGHVRPSPAKTQDERAARPARGEAETV